MVRHDRLITQLGGKAEMARALGLPVTRLSKWHVRGIPSKYWVQVADLAVTKGMAITVRDLVPATTEAA